MAKFAAGPGHALTVLLGPKSLYQNLLYVMACDQHTAKLRVRVTANLYVVACGQAHTAKLRVRVTATCCT